MVTTGGSGFYSFCGHGYLSGLNMRGGRLFFGREANPSGPQDDVPLDLEQHSRQAANLVI